MKQQDFELELNENEGGISQVYCFSEAKFKLSLDQKKKGHCQSLIGDIDLQKIASKTKKPSQNPFASDKKSPYYKWAVEQVQKYTTHSSDTYFFDKYNQNERKIVKSSQQLF